MRPGVRLLTAGLRKRRRWPRLGRPPIRRQRLCWGNWPSRAAPMPMRCGCSSRSPAATLAASRSRARAPATAARPPDHAVRLLTTVLAQATRVGRRVVAARRRAAQGLKRAHAPTISTVRLLPRGPIPAVDPRGARCSWRLQPPDTLRSFKSALAGRSAVGTGARRSSRAPSRTRIHQPPATRPARRSPSIPRSRAHLLLAQLDLDNTRYDAAREPSTRFLRNNEPTSSPVRCSRPSPTVRSAASVRRRGQARAGDHPSYVRSTASPSIWRRQYRFDEAVALHKRGGRARLRRTPRLGDLGST